ncbi:MAG: acyl-CoA dehydrogenase family protein [Desulfuromonadaceae bacterium]|nr:acyl-CoA dehydrogenase family protein [Desulfuromonadaceae bacterium]
MSCFDFETIDRLARCVLAPHSKRWDRDGIFPRAALKILAEHGLFGLRIATDLGGSGASCETLVRVIEAIARHDAGVALTLAAHSLVCDHLRWFGTPQQQQQYLPDLARGEKLGAWALAESGSGSDAASIRCRAEKNEDGWLLNGRKMFVTQGNWAGLYVVLARTSDERRNAVSAFLVDPASPGVQAGPALEKMGCRSSNTCPLSLKNVQIADQALLGEEGRALSAALTLLDQGRIAISALACGLIRACLEDATRHAKRRQQFGRPIAQFQAIQWMLADMATEHEAAWLLTHHAAQLADTGASCGIAGAKAKLFSSRSAVACADRAVQIFGGYGYLKNVAVERYYRDAKVCEIGEGTSEIQRLVIARDLLRE